MKKVIIILTAAILALVSCGQNKSANEPKTLVLYYSQTSTTKTVAELIQSKTGSDIEAIEVVNPYGDYASTVERGRQEVVSENLPELKPLNVNINDYDIIYLGYPVWYGTVSNPILSLIQDVDFAGKKVVPFCTFGSGGSNTSRAALEAALPKATVGPCYGVRQARIDKAEAEVERFLIENGFIEGTIDALDDYSSLKPCSAEETEIFNAAISTYPMLNGTVAAEVGSRSTKTGTDYIFTAGAEGSPVNMKILVTVNEGSDPEFTEVLR